MKATSLELYRQLRAPLVLPPYSARGLCVEGLNADGLSESVARVGTERSARFLAAVLNEWHDALAKCEDSR
jgi:hypothetical protein